MTDRTATATSGTAGSATTTWLRIEPMDTVMVRDGRSFDAGGDSTAVAATPSPATFGGLVKALHGRNVERILGPVVHVGDVPLFPAPGDLARVTDELGGTSVRRLAVTERREDEVTDLDPEDPAQRLTHAVSGDGEPVGEWLTVDGMAAWLAQDETMRSGAPVGGHFLRPVPWRREPRIGMARNPDTGTVREGFLYSAEHLRPVNGQTFVVGCENPEPVRVPEPTMLPLGGQMRQATVSLHRWGDPFPPAPENFPGGRVAVCLVTPGLVDDVRWCPAGTSARLRAFVVSGPHPVSTASPSRMRDSRSLMWTVPAGSVYYLEFDDADEARDWAYRYHGKLLPGVSASDRPVVTAGFGTCVTGRW